MDDEDKDISSNLESVNERETMDDALNEELENKSNASESSEKLETLEDVQNLPVKQSLEKQSEKKEPVSEKEGESDSLSKKNETLKAEKQQEDISQKDKEALLLREDEIEASKTEKQQVESLLQTEKEGSVLGEDEIEAPKREEQQGADALQKDKEGSLLSDDEEVGKEEKRREKMKVLLSGYLEMKTRKEIEKALLNEKKIIAQWLYPFRGTYQKEWELEMKKLKLGFQRALDFKKAHIEAIQTERKLVELNHLWADSAHYKISQELFDFLNLRCEKLKTRYMEELEETKRYYLEREKEITDKCTKAEERAKALARMRRTVHDKTLQKTNETIERFRDESEFYKVKETELIKMKHLTHVEIITKELQASISPPEHKIEEIRALFMDWKTKYEGYLTVSEKIKKRMENYGKEIPQLEAKVASERKKLEDIRKENKMEKQIRMEEVTRLQKEARNYDKLDPSLRKMITASEEVMIQLRERKSKLDKIRKLKTMCDKLETENDNILSDIILLEPNEMKDLKENDCLPMITDLCAGNVEDHNLLHNVHRKISKVKLQNQFLLHNIENLKIENKALKSDMKKYLHLISRREWERLPEDKYATLYELPGKTSQNAHVPAESDKHERFKANLKLLNNRFHPSNKELIRGLGNM
ncbi:dynein regulatory complex subunit 2-like [Parasteatoda tepidariorum]|uniref:dynein regulatory complex subunit 2-like n=1 Tax=Parasteatoda tepidariorum TaxID=114398 RepID=UPI0039BCAEC3